MWFNDLKNNITLFFVLFSPFFCAQQKNLVTNLTQTHPKRTKARARVSEISWQNLAGRPEAIFNLNASDVKINFEKNTKTETKPVRRGSSVLF